MDNKIRLSGLICTVAVFQLNVISAQANTEAARVNNTVISVEALNQHYNNLAQQGFPNLTKRKALDDLIKKEVAVSEARKLKLDQDSKVQERVNNVLYMSLLENKLGKSMEQINPKETELKSWYERNPEVRTSHIFVAAPAGISKDEEQAALTKLNNALKEIRSGKTSFAESAQRNSEDSSAALGGDLDYRGRDRLDPAYYQAAIKIGKVGEVTGPIRTPFGFHLIRLTAKRSWIEADRARVQRLFIDEKRQEIASRYLNELQQKARVSINNAVVKD